MFQKLENKCVRKNQICYTTPPVVESETIESDVVEKSQFQRPTFDHESKYETLMLHARYYYTVIFIRSNPIG